MYAIRMGVPEMEALWKDLSQRAKAGDLKKDEEQFFKKWVKAMEFLRENPRHPGLKSHEIDAISKRLGLKVWQSYLENRNSSARRMFWVYGPGPKEITILAVEPHPEDDKRGGYERVKLSKMPEEN